MIDLTPLDVRKKRGDFRQKLRGYDSEEVDTFLEVVGDRLEDLVKENLGLKEKVQLLQARLETLEGREQAVQDALVSAQALRKEVQDQTRNDAEVLKSQAEREIDLLRREAESELEARFVEAQDLMNERRRALEDLERNRRKFLKAFRSLLERELDSVEVEEARRPLEDVPLDIDLRGWRRKETSELRVAVSEGLQEAMPSPAQDLEPPQDASQGVESPAGRETDLSAIRETSSPESPDSPAEATGEPEIGPWEDAGGFREESDMEEPELPEEVPEALEKPSEDLSWDDPFLQSVVGEAPEEKVPEHQLEAAPELPMEGTSEPPGEAAPEPPMEGTSEPPREAAPETRGEGRELEALSGEGDAGESAAETGTEGSPDETPGGGGASEPLWLSALLNREDRRRESPEAPVEEEEKGKGSSDENVDGSPPEHDDGFRRS